MKSVTRGEFASICSEYAKAGGVSYIDVSTLPSTALNQVINRGLKDFTRFAYCLYTSSYTLTLSANVAEYEVDPLFWVETVTINGNILRNREGKVGPENRHYLFETFSNFQTAAAGLPIHWIPMPGQKILLFPKPDQAYTCYLSGFSEHPTINVSGSADSTILSIEDNVVDLAALWISQKLKFPHIEGEDVFNKIMTLDQYAAKKLKDLSQSNRGASIGLARRGGRVRTLRV